MLLELQTTAEQRCLPGIAKNLKHSSHCEPLLRVDGLNCEHLEQLLGSQ